MTTIAAIRTPNLDDVDRLARVHLTCWQQAYAGIVSQELLDSFTLAERAQAWTRILESTDNGRFVAEVDGEIVGFSSSGPGHGDDPPRPFELYSIYVLAEHHGAGVGQSLIDAALGTAPAFVWLATGNGRARSFYARNGFVADGVTKAYERWEDMPEIRMVR